MKKITYIGAILLLIIAGGVSLYNTNTAKAEMSKADIEKIVEDYIKNNGGVILEAVNSYQIKSAQEKTQAQLGSNTRKIFEDDRDPTAGSDDAKLRVVEFFDYNCGYCKRVIGDINRVIEEQTDVKVIFKEFPILGPTSETATRWALASHKQGKYLEFHTKLLEHKGRLNDDVLNTIATDLALNIDTLKADAQSDEITQHIADNRALAQSLDITGTPAFILEDEIVPGAIGYDQIKSTLDSKRK